MGSVKCQNLLGSLLQKSKKCFSVFLVDLEGVGIINPPPHSIYIQKPHPPVRVTETDIIQAKLSLICFLEQPLSGQLKWQFLNPDYQCQSITLKIFVATLACTWSGYFLMQVEKFTSGFSGLGHAFYQT